MNIYNDILSLNSALSTQVTKLKGLTWPQSMLSYCTKYQQRFLQGSGFDAGSEKLDLKAIQFGFIRLSFHQLAAWELKINHNACLDCLVHRGWLILIDYNHNAEYKSFVVWHFLQLNRKVIQ